MTGFELQTWHLVLGGTLLVVIFMIGLVVAITKLYQRASADEALIRTGKGGVHVSIGGGMMVLPVLQQVMRVGLRTIVLNVRREGKSQALVTKDKIKACCTMELYIKVAPTTVGVTQAAQSFGNKNLDGDALKDIVEGKLTDALRGVAANQNYSELHANRDQFAEEVKKALVTELEKNGLLLESTSLTELTQLPQSEMDANDVFDAEGLRNISTVVSTAQEEVNQINNTRTITIQQQNVAARKRALELEQEQKFLEADQSRKVAEYQATQETEQTKAVLAQQQASKEAGLAQHRAVEEARITSEQQVATRDLHRQKAIAEETSSKAQAEQVAQIGAERAIETANIARAKDIENAEIDKQQTIETAVIKKQQAIALADAEKAAAEAQKNLAEADEAAAKEKIATAVETARAERAKEIQVIKANEESERERINADKEAYTARVGAEADYIVKQQQAMGEKARAEGVANAVREKARAEADAKKMSAEADKEAAKLNAEGEALRVTEVAKATKEAAIMDAEAKLALAEAIRQEGDAKAEAAKKLQDANNSIDSRLLMREVALEAVRVSPDLMREFVKSASAIGEIKVVQIDGMGGGGNGEGGLMSELSKTPLGLGFATLAQSTALLPVYKALMDHSGIDLNPIVARLKDAAKSGLQSMTEGPQSPVAAGALAGAASSLAANATSKLTGTQTGRTSSNRRGTGKPSGEDT